MRLKKILRNNLAKILYLLGYTAPRRRGYGRLSIVTFHRVLPVEEIQSYPFPGLAVTPDELDKYLSYFTEHFDCGTLAAQHKRYESGEKSSRPLLAITFDDAQYDNYKYAREVLSRHNVKASFFIPVEAVVKREFLWHDRLGFAILNLLSEGHAGRDRLMQILDKAGVSVVDSGNIVSSVAGASKVLSLDARLSLVKSLVEASGVDKQPEFARIMTFAEIAELAADGHEIGSHSMTHCLMPECDDQSLSYEIAESRRVLQSRLGLEIPSFCYPNGNSDARTAQEVERAGYCCAVTTDWGSNGLEADKFRLRRFDMVARHVQDSNGKFIPAILAFRMSGYYPGLG